MATTGIRKAIGSNALAFAVTDANGAPALVPGVVATDAAGNALGGKATIADGDSVTLGTKADAAATDSTSSWTVVALLKGLWALLNGKLKVVGSVASGSADGDAPVKAGGKASTTVGGLTAYTTGQRADLALGTNGNIITTLGLANDGSTGVIAMMIGRGTNVDALPATSTAGQIGAISFGEVFNGSTWDRVKKASLTSRIASSANTTNATVAKASAGDLFAIQGYNTTASVVYLKLYNKATAPTVGTDTPVKTIAIPPNAPIPANCAWANGLYFSTGIAYALTGAAADNDTTAVAAGAIVGLNLDYQ